MEDIERILEALIFTSEQSISIEELQFCLQGAFEADIDIKIIEKHLRAIRSKFDDDKSAIELVKTGNGYQFLTKKQYHVFINHLQQQQSKKKLSQAAIETLAIIAYKQPITRIEIEQIRGVNCDYTLQKLLDKDLITMAGKADSVGKPILYVTSIVFMDYFGINNITELPHVKEMATNGEVIGGETE